MEDPSEVPNQSERSMQEDLPEEENSEQAQSEAISSGTDGNFSVLFQNVLTSFFSLIGPSNVTVSQACPSVAVTLPSYARTRPVAPLTRQQQSHLLLPHGIDEGGDDGNIFF